MGCGKQCQVAIVRVSCCGMHQVGILLQRSTKTGLTVTQQMHEMASRTLTWSQEMLKNKSAHECHHGALQGSGHGVGVDAFATPNWNEFDDIAVKRLRFGMGSSENSSKRKSGLQLVDLHNVSSLHQHAQKSHRGETAMMWRVPGPLELADVRNSVGRE